MHGRRNPFTKVYGGRPAGRPASNSWGRALKVIQLDLYWHRFRFSRICFASFLAKQHSVNFSRPYHIGVFYTQIFFTDPYCFLVEGFGVGMFLFAIVE